MVSIQQSTEKENSSLQEQTLTTESWDTYLRLFWVWWFTGSMAGLWLLFVTESVSTIGWPRIQLWFLCAVYTPALAIGFGFWRHKTRSSPTQETSPNPEWLRVVIGLVVFVMWGGGYYLIGFLTAHQTTHDIAIAADQWLPLLPSTSFVYVTVQWFVIVAVTVSLDRIPWRKVLLASASTLLLCDIFFLTFPVAVVRAPLQITNLSTWVLSLIHTGDVSNNCFPSSHCAMALLCALFLFHKGRWQGWLGLFCAISIGLSTLTTKQHYVLDVIVGFGIAGAVYTAWFVWPLKSTYEETGGKAMTTSSEGAGTIS